MKLGRFVAIASFTMIASGFFIGLIVGLMSRV